MRNAGDELVLGRCGGGDLRRHIDLAAALDAGEIAGVGLDVYQIEPLPSEHPLWTIPGVLMTPHIAGVGPYLQERRTEILLENCRRFNVSEPLLNIVDKANWF